MKKKLEISKDRKIYLVINPSMEEVEIIEKLKVITTKEIAAVQIWDNFKEGQDIVAFIRKIHAICQAKAIPLLINNRWEYLMQVALDGVHFDVIPDNIACIKSKLNREIIIGITCGNNLDAVEWAAQNKVDYISFCAMFPSESAGDCEIVDHQTVQKARAIFNKPLFLAGGIYPNNIRELSAIDFDGIAVISGVMRSENPIETINEYENEIKKIK